MSRLSILATLIAVITFVPSARLASGEQPAAQTTVHESRFEVAGVPGPFDVLQRVVDFPPGAWAPPHVHGGPAVVTLLDGEILVRQMDGTEARFTAGQAWAEDPSQVHATGNEGARTARILATILLPKRAPVTTLVQQAAPTQPAPATAPAPAQVPRVR